MLLRLGLRNIAQGWDATWNHQITEITNAYSLSSGNVQSMKIKAEHSNKRSHQELSDQPFEGWKKGKAHMWKWLGWVHFWKDVWKIQNYTGRNDWRETHPLLPNKGSAKFRHREELKGMCLGCIWRWKTNPSLQHAMRFARKGNQSQLHLSLMFLL